MKRFGAVGRRERRAARGWRAAGPERVEERRLLAAVPSGTAGIDVVAWQGRVVEARTDHWVGRLSAHDASSAGVARLGVDLAVSHPGWRATSLGGDGFVLDAPGAAPDDVLGWAATAETVAAIEPDFAFQVTALPDDPLLSTQWALRNSGQNGGTIGADIRAAQAWDVTTGSRSVVVGIVDSGIDVTHPDLAANIWTNPGEIPGNGVDDDHNGYVDDIHGWNFVDNTGNVDDGYGHGTHVAGIVGAVGNNGIGVAGVNWQVSLMALKFEDSRGIGYTSSVLAALNYATMMRRDHGIDIVATNNSWQSLGGFSSLVQEAIRAEGDAGIVFVAAAGNSAGDNDTTPSYPACYRLQNTITVAAIDGSGALAGLSNYGATSVDLAAPGIMIESTFPGGGYGTLSGTSMAAPQVAGVVALLAAARPGISVADVKAAILGSTAAASSLAGRTVTGGRLDARAALDFLNLPAGSTPPASTQQPPPAPPPAPTPPTAPVVSLLNDTGASAADRVTADGRLAVTGLDADARVEYSVNAGRTWADTFTARPGVNAVSVRQTNSAGLRSPTTALRFTLDSVAPAAPRVALARDTGASATDRITRIGTLRVFAEKAARVEYSTDDGATWADSFTAVEGANAVRVRQTDVAGNMSPPTATALAFTLLATSPQLVTAPTATFTPQVSGGVIDVTLAFDRRLRVTVRPGSLPTIDVTFGGQLLRATLVGGGGTSQLHFRCRVPAAAVAAANADPSNPGLVTVGAFRLSYGSLIQDLAGNRLDIGAASTWLGG